MVPTGTRENFGRIPEKLHMIPARESSSANIRGFHRAESLPAATKAAPQRIDGRQTTALSFSVERPLHEPGFRLVRQEGADRRVRYFTISYATDAPEGERDGRTH